MIVYCWLFLWKLLYGIAKYVRSDNLISIFMGWHLRCDYIIFYGQPLLSILFVNKFYFYWNDQSNSWMCRITKYEIIIAVSDIERLQTKTERVSIFWRLNCNDLFDTDDFVWFPMNLNAFLVFLVFLVILCEFLEIFDDFNILFFIFFFLAPKHVSLIFVIPNDCTCITQPGWITHSFSKFNKLMPYVNRNYCFIGILCEEYLWCY